jgi:hypothetical protein
VFPHPDRQNQPLPDPTCAMRSSRLLRRGATMELDGRRRELAAELERLLTEPT